MTPKTLVVPLDGSEFSEHALPVARAIAEGIDARLLLVSVLERGPLRPGEYLDEVAARYPGLAIDTVPVTDRYAADAIATIVADADDGIVCMTSHGRGGLRWSMIGSTAEEVVRRSDGPTILVGRHCRDDFLTRGSRLLVCADGSDASKHLAPPAREWADRLDLGLTAAIVVHPLDVESAKHEQALAASVAEPFGGSDQIDATVLTNRYVQGALADLADDIPAAIIVMNCHARTGLARIALGSVTMGVLNLASCPLLVTHIP